MVRKPRTLAPAARVSILVPMRNEADNVTGVITGLLAQTELAEREIIVLNDHSTDHTATLLDSYPISVLTGKNLPSGWLGKNFACYQLSQAAQGDFLVFVDADVRLTPTAVSAAIGEMERLNWDFASPYPRQIARTFLEVLIQPLLQWSWFATVPLRIAEKFHVSSMAVANGQFFIIRKTAYAKVGGHSAIKSDVLDDIALARTLLKSGFRGGVMEASDIASCRMYDNARDLINGYRKSLWRAFGSIWGSALAIGFLAISALAPWWFAFHGELIGWIGAGAGVLSRAIVAIRTRSRWHLALLHPLAIASLIALILWSWWGKVRGTLTWRERAIP